MPEASSRLVVAREASGARQGRWPGKPVVPAKAGGPGEATGPGKLGGGPREGTPPGRPVTRPSTRPDRPAPLSSHPPNLSYKFDRQNRKKSGPSRHDPPEEARPWEWSCTGSCPPTVTRATDLSLGQRGRRGRQPGHGWWHGGRRRARAPGPSAIIGQIARFRRSSSAFSGAPDPRPASWCEGRVDHDRRADPRSPTGSSSWSRSAPASLSPTLGRPHAADPTSAVSGGRLLLNVVTGGDDVGTAAFGDHLGKDARYEAGRRVPCTSSASCGGGEPVTFSPASHYDVAAAGRSSRPRIWPEDLPGAGPQPRRSTWAARYADVYLTWGEPPHRPFAGKNWETRCGPRAKQPAGKGALSGSACT